MKLQYKFSEIHASLFLYWSRQVCTPFSLNMDEQ